MEEWFDIESHKCTDTLGLCQAGNNPYEKYPGYNSTIYPQFGHTHYKLFDDGNITLGWNNITKAGSTPVPQDYFCRFNLTYVTTRCDTYHFGCTNYILTNNTNQTTMWINLARNGTDIHKPWIRLPTQYWDNEAILEQQKHTKGAFLFYPNIRNFNIIFINRQANATLSDINQARVVNITHLEIHRFMDLKNRQVSGFSWSTLFVLIALAGLFCRCFLCTGEKTA